MSPFATHAPAPQPTTALPVDATTLYPEPDGFFGRRAKARRAKLLDGVAPVLRKALAPGEAIRYAARATRVFTLEQLFVGAAAAYHNMVALVITDRRVLMVQLDRRGRAGDMKHELALAAIRRARRGALSGFRLELADGTKLAFGAIRGGDRKRLEALVPRSEAPARPGPSLVHLCPACLRPVPGGPGSVAACPQPDCRIPFRDPRRAARLSALVPGLGDLYLRHHFFGSLEFLGSMFALGIGVAFALAAVADPEPATVAAAATIGILALAVPRAIDYPVTLHMGRKGLVPLALAPAPGSQARNLPSYPRWSPLLFAAGIAIAGAFPLAMAGSLGHDRGVRQASRLAADGRFDEAMARWGEVASSDGATDERRLRFALALLEAGDLEDADAVRETVQGKVGAELAGRWNTAQGVRQAAEDAYGEGLKALARGDAARAGPLLDGALSYLRRVKRPHVPASRGEAEAHLAAELLAEPVEADRLARAEALAAGMAGAPPAEVAIVRAALDSARGARSAARAALAGADVAAAPPRLRLLALEARARLAEDDGEREAVRSAARAFPRGGLIEKDGPRLDRLAAAPR